jgi:hypothetical protein
MHKLYESQNILTQICANFVKVEVSMFKESLEQSNSQTSKLPFTFKYNNCRNRIFKDARCFISSR